MTEKTVKTSVPMTEVKYYFIDKSEPTTVLTNTIVFPKNIKEENTIDRLIKKEITNDNIKYVGIESVRRFKRVFSMYKNHFINDCDHYQDI